MRTITKKKRNNSAIEKKFDKHGNKVSIYETVKEVDGKQITKENVTKFTRYNTTSLQSDNVENIDEINYLLMIETGVTEILKLEN